MEVSVEAAPGTEPLVCDTCKRADVAIAIRISGSPGQAFRACRYCAKDLSKLIHKHRKEIRRLPENVVFMMPE